jgi:hypothetical protein
MTTCHKCAVFVCVVAWVTTSLSVASGQSSQPIAPPVATPVDDGGTELGGEARGRQPPGDNPVTRPQPPGESRGRRVQVGISKVRWNLIHRERCG